MKKTFPPLDRMPLSDPLKEYLPMDHEYWEQLFKLPEVEYDEAYTVLHGFRCAGARLKMEKGHLKLKPRIGYPFKWQSREEYREDRKEYLMPHRDRITELLSKTEEHLE